MSESGSERKGRCHSRGLWICRGLVSESFALGKSKSNLTFVESHPFDSAQGRLLPQKRESIGARPQGRGKDGAPGPIVFKVVWVALTSILPLYLKV